MFFTFQCDYCGATVTRERKHGSYPHRFCGYSCAAKWRAKNGCAPTGPRSVAGGLPHKNVRIRMTKELELFPEFRPECGETYPAERYAGQGGIRRPGYVICVNGHRINIRADECVEV